MKIINLLRRPQTTRASPSHTAGARVRGAGEVMDGGGGLGWILMGGGG
jgi:hypothetical protein